MKQLKIFFLVTLLSCISIYSQETKTFTFSADDSFLFKELTAIVQIKDGSLIFELIPEQKLKEEKFKNVNLMKGDEILFINGKRVKTIDELKNVYAQVEIGKEIQLGIKRGKERFFTSLIKENETQSGEHMMIINKESMGKDNAFEKSIQLDGNKVNVDSLKKSGEPKVITKTKKKDN